MNEWLLAGLALFGMVGTFTFGYWIGYMSGWARRYDKEGER